MSTTTELAKIDVDEIAEIMQGASAVLSKNENLALAAEKGGQQLLDTIEAEGMNDELDSAANQWQVKAKDAAGILNKRRVPITQVIDKMKSFFTELEGKIDPKKPNSVYSKIQAKRNEWAGEKAKKAKAEQDAIIKKQNIANEKISLAAEIATQIKQIYNTKLFTFKKFVTDTYDKLTIDNAAEIKGKINDVKINYPLEAFDKIVPTVFAKYLNDEQVGELIVECRAKLYDDCAANFREIMEAHKNETLDLIPSRINELKAIAKSSEAERKRLEEQAEERRLQKVKDEQEAAKQKALDDAKAIEDQKKKETAGNLFDSAAALAQVKESTGKSREGYTINVLDTSGIADLFMFYFEKEGRGLTVEKFLKKDFTQIKAFAEKFAHKNDEKIISEHLQYEETYKAIASKG
ncbi:hypothetical protein [Pedobacter sp. Leaf170]|uniref:hypothetical protein n=1 Tax=Pedobacter sp. Leaf170 TaxID=2876558 RepID=UPI001E55500C|nr:hypothetical protein [Pedobacter sp. Leaf170]